MATINLILSIEKTNIEDIHLHKEGLFWKAYQQSAYRMSHRPFVDYKLKKKYVKAVCQEVVSIGFPESGLAKNFNPSELEYVDNNHIRVKSSTIDIEDYNNWFFHLPVYEAIKPVVVFSAQNTLFAESVSSQPGTEKKRNTILRRLRDFRVEQATPIDCMLFISSIQKELSALDELDE